jgi:hypothetical protein
MTSDVRVIAGDWCVGVTMILLGVRKCTEYGKANVTLPEFGRIRKAVAVEHKPTIYD